MPRPQTSRFGVRTTTRRMPLSRGAAAVLAALPLAVLGQALDPAQLREADDDRTDLTYQNLTVDEIEDMNVVRGDTRVGEIEEVLVNDRDVIVAVVVDLEARAAGGADRDVVVPIDALEFDATRRRATTTLTAEEIAALPVWPDD